MEIRLDEGVQGSRTLSMKIRNEGDGWIRSKGKKKTLWKNVGIRADWKNMAKERGKI